MILAHLAHVAHAPLAMFFQEAGGSANTFTIMSMWASMSWPPRIIVIILFIMSIWSLAVMIDRAMYFDAARKQSRKAVWMRQSSWAIAARSRTSPKSSPPVCRSSAALARAAPLPTSRLRARNALSNAPKPSFTPS